MVGVLADWLGDQSVAVLAGTWAGQRADRLVDKMVVKLDLHWVSWKVVMMDE